MVDDPLARGHERAGQSRQVVCIGDSTTRAFAGGRFAVPGQGWVELLTTALAGGFPGQGFRGLWRPEWKATGTWTRILRSDTFDVAPFESGLLSAGDAVDELTWTKPEGSTVAAFDLYVVDAPDAGLQFRVDDGAWVRVGQPDPCGEGALRRVHVDTPVRDRVQIRSDGTDSRRVAIAGLDAYAVAPPADGVRVHDLSVGMNFLTQFCRASAGDPLALLDALRPELVIVAFSNDVLWLADAQWDAALRLLAERVAPYGRVLFVSTFEQRPPRRVHDVVTAAGSRTLRSADAEFLPSDVNENVSGARFPDAPPTTIVSVESTEECTVSEPALDTLQAAEIEIGRGREAADQARYRAITKRVAEETGNLHLDIYDAWSAQGSTGWTAAFGRGLMADRYHASVRGHRDIADRLLNIMGADEGG